MNCIGVRRVLSSKITEIIDVTSLESKHEFLTRSDNQAYVVSCTYNHQFDGA